MDKSLIEYYNNDNLSFYTTYSYSIKTCKTLEELFNLWVKTDTLA